MIYDCFMFNGEFDILEIRLNILDPYVDKFILCESIETFSGLPKPLFFEEQKERFSKWINKIVRIETPQKDFPNAFERAAYQKDGIREALALYCKPDDIIYFGDVDEIWTPQTEEGKLEQLNYSYYLNLRSSELWQGTNVFRYKNIKNLNEIRADHSKILKNGGWHLTNMGGVNEVLRKLESYDHQEMNTEENRILLADRIKDREDYAGRDKDWLGKPFTFKVDETELPKYILDNRLRYEHLFT